MKKLGFLLGLLSCLSFAYAAPDCTPSPWGERELFLRGSFNQWKASDTERFAYVCDRHVLYVRLKGEHSFKIGDEDWSPDADLGGRLDKLELKGPALSRRFDGDYKLELRMNKAVTPALELAIEPYVGVFPKLSEAPTVSDPVALSLRFDSREPAHKTPFGAIAEGSTVQFALTAKPGVAKATLVLEKRRMEGNQELLEYTEVARLPMSKSSAGVDERWSASFRFADKAVYGYYFEVEIGGKRFVYQNNKDSIYWTREKGSMGLGLVEPMPDAAKRIRRYRQTVHAADFKVPGWARDAVYYYIFPDRFRNGDRANDPQPGRDRYQDKHVELHKNWLDKPWKPAEPGQQGDGSDDVYNNDFFGGDLAGIIEKLDYIKELGANTIYMTPVFKAASNHKYDTADYRHIDPAFGSNEDFTRLTVEAAKRGLRVIPDTSLNHVGSDSIYFDRFKNHNSKGAFEGGKVRRDSPYADWFIFDTSKTDPDKQYQGWVGVSDLPEINKASKSFRSFAYGAPDSIMKLWLDRGASGWRMDVAPWVPDDFWREWRSAIKTHKSDALLIAETWFDASKFFLGDSFDSTMNYIFRDAVLDYAAGGDARKLYPNIELMREAYPPQAFYALMNLLSTHDKARALHHFGYTETQGRHDVALAPQGEPGSLGRPGAGPSDGDAAKLAQAKQRLRLALLLQMSFPGAPAVYYGDEVGVAGGDDPYNRATYPWADQGGAPDLALLEDFKRLIRLRKELPVLRHGTLSAPLLLSEHVIVLARRDGQRWAITAVNNDVAAHSVTLRVPDALHGKTLRDALGGTASVVNADGELRLDVPALFGSVLTFP
jgi:glycosidase